MLNRIDVIIFVTIFIGFYILFAAGLSIIKDEELKQEYFAATCEAKNGVWIKNVVGSGKNEKVLPLGCFKPEALIDIK